MEFVVVEEHQDGVTFGETLQPNDEIMVQAEGYRLSALGLQVTKADLTWAEYCAMGQQLQSVEKSIRWWVGDWCNLGEHRWGDKYTQALDYTGNKLTTVMKWAWVARRIPYQRRRLELTMTHHEMIAKFEPAEQTRWLDLAVKEEWTTRELSEAIQQAEMESRPRTESLESAEETSLRREVLRNPGGEDTFQESGYTNKDYRDHAESRESFYTREDHYEPSGPNTEPIKALQAAADLLAMPYEQNNEANIQRAYELIERAVNLLGGSL